MENESKEFRDRLLQAQQMTPGLREEYQVRLAAIAHCQLTPQSRAVVWVALLAAIASAALCVRSLIIHHAKQDVKIILPVYAALSLGMAVWFARVLWEGGFARRSWFKVTERLGSIAVAVYVAVTLFRGLQTPSDPASTLGAVWATLFAMVGFFWSTGSHIASVGMETKEQLLRLEMRLMELGEKKNPK